MGSLANRWTEAGGGPRRGRYSCRMLSRNWPSGSIVRGGSNVKVYAGLAGYGAGVLIWYYLRVSDSRTGLRMIAKFIRDYIVIAM